MGLLMTCITRHKLYVELNTALHVCQLVKPPAQVPCDPKLLVKPLTTEQLASFWLTTVEKLPKKDLFFEPDNGIPLNLLDLEKYEIPDNPPPLAPEDEALLAVRPQAAAGMAAWRPAASE